MIIQKENETRLNYLLRVAIQFCEKNGESLINYDETTCDGYCLADELQYYLDEQE